MGNITYGFFTLPFKFEGKKKAKIAKEALKDIRRSVNAFSVIPNDRIFKIIDKASPLKKALAVVNEHLSEAIQGLLEIIYGTGIINIDFADLKTIFSGKGKLAYLNSVRVQKKDSKEKVFEKIISSPLYPYTIKNGKSVLFNIAGQRNLSLDQVNKIAEAVSKEVSKSAKIIFGISKSKKVTITKVNVLVVGCKDKKIAKKKKKKKSKKKKKKKKKTLKKDINIKLAEIKKVDLPSRTKNLLFEEGIKKVEDLIQKSEKELLEIKGMGGARIKKIKKFLNSVDLSLQAVKKTTKKKKKKKKEQGVIKIKKEESTKKIRKNALQVKEDIKQAKEEIISKENMWKKPTFLRKK
jgi:cell division protein FtsZ